MCPGETFSKLITQDKLCSPTLTARTFRLLLTWKAPFIMMQFECFLPILWQSTVKQPEGYELAGRCLFLSRALYGLLSFERILRGPLVWDTSRERWLFFSWISGRQSFFSYRRIIVHTVSDKQNLPQYYYQLSRQIAWAQRPLEWGFLGAYE